MHVCRQLLCLNSDPSSFFLAHTASFPSPPFFLADTASSFSSPLLLPSLASTLHSFSPLLLHSRFLVHTPFLSPSIIYIDPPSKASFGRGTITHRNLYLGHGEDSGSVFQLQRVRDNSSARRATTAISRRPLQLAARTWRLHCHWAQDLLQDWLLVLCCV